ncbi:MAG: aminopeptidase P family protein [Caldilineaceae bacterium]|nr:aminopeptidase P family protein [Caldilineaceae bacterium]
MQPSADQRHAVQLDVVHYRDRVQAIAAALAQRDLEGVLLLDAANIMWATGFFHIPNERPLGLYIPARGDEPTFYVPLLERENVEESWIPHVRWYLEFPGETPAPVWMMEQIPHDRIGVDHAGHAAFLAMQRAKPGLVIDNVVAPMRYLKHEAEVALIRLASEYADYGQTIARQAVADELSNGITELDVVEIVQRETTAKMRRELTDLISFYRGAVALTAHTGARGALPHGQPGPTVIRPGDTLIVGIGVKVGGYHAESGCTYVVGEPTPDQRRCLEATWACDEAALQALYPGNSCAAVNEAAWAALREAGYGDFIRHRIGHGMGVEGHEAPWLSPGDATVLAPTMVFSNEPGIYRPGLDGYRIIDTMVVTPEGGRRLSRYLSEHGPADRVIEI